MDQFIDDLTFYVEKYVRTICNKRLKILNELKLIPELKRKCPYLYISKNVLLSTNIVKSIIDENLSFLEESILNDFLKDIAIYINSKIFNGQKSSIENIDLEFKNDNIRYIVIIKSGSNWGNSSQVQRMRDNFRKAKDILQTRDSHLNIIAVNGCCYGVEKKPDKGDYYKYCGQRFWEFISGDSEMYTKISEPLGLIAKEKNETFMKTYYQLLNKFTYEFGEKFCIDGKINWKELVKFISA